MTTLRGSPKVRLALACIFAGVCAFVPNVHAQTADEILAQAQDTLHKQGPNGALPQMQRALELYREKQDRHGEAVALGSLGYCYEEMSDYPKALDYLQRALALKRELGDRLEEAKTLNIFGLDYWDTSDYSKAIDHFNRALAIAREFHNQQLEGSSLNNLALVLEDQGKYSQAIDFYQKALAIHRATHFTRGETDTLGNLGGDNLLLGRFEEAQNYYQQALALDEAQKMNPSIVKDLDNLGQCQLGLGQPEEALKSFNRALALAREARMQKEEADAQKGTGEAYLRLGKYDAAREAYQQVIAIYERAGLKRERIEALNDDGTLHAMLGDDVTAEKDFRAASDLAQAIGHPRGVTDNLLSLGDLEWRRHRYDQAAAAFREAYQCANAAGDKGAMAASQLELSQTLRDQGKLEDAVKSAQEALEIGRATGAKPEEAQADYLLGDLGRRQGQLPQALDHFAAGEAIVGTSPDSDLTWRLAYGRGQTLEAMGKDEDAAEAYRRAVSIIEDIRNQLREERFQSGFIEDKYQVYVSLIHLLLKLKKLSEAFTFSEKLRALNYQHVLNASALPGGGVEEERLRSQIRQLQRAIAEEKSKPSQERKEEAVSSLSSELAAAEQKYQSLVDDLQGKQPAYAALNGLATPPAESVQGALPPHAALLEYVVGDDSTTIFLITPDKLQGLTVPARADDLRSRIELFRDLVRQGKSDDWRKPGESLRRLLIEPVERSGGLKDITRLYVVPNGILYYLPFAALPRAAASGERFLIQDYEVVSLPTSAALVYSSDTVAPEKKLLALAPSSSRLRYAPLEARAVEASFPENSLALLGSTATKRAFESQAGEFQFIHLATHGFFDKFNPLFSGVELEPDGRDDGRLEVYEILRMKLRARLVTLSACETGLGSGYFSEIPPGDDFVGLTRAFLSAGSSAVLSSLWEVNDRSTLQLMESFYRNLQKEGSAGALRKAQLAMLEAGGRFSQPYYWAAFVLVGAKK